MPSLLPALVFGDMHVPYHDERALGLMLKVAKDLKPVFLISLGDFVDFYSISSHRKDRSRLLTLESELKVANEVLDKLDSLGCLRKIYIAGNHCDRLDAYLTKNAPELYGMLGIESLLKLQERGWEYIPYRQFVKLGDFHFTHDGGGAGKYDVYRMAELFQSNIVSGHNHTLGQVGVGTIEGGVYYSYKIGWMGDANSVDYMAKAQVLKSWQLGFGVGYLDSDMQRFYLTLVPIVDYTCVVGGSLYREKS